MLELVIAPSGLGKTHYILENIKKEKNNNKIIVVTPDQNSYNFEKILCKEFLGTFNIDVVNLSRLYKKLSIMLNIDIEQISDADKYCCYLELLKKFEGKDNFLIDRLAQDVEFINIINDLIEEFDEYVVDIDKLKEYSELSIENKEKLNDIVEVYRVYKELLLENSKYSKLDYIENIVKGIQYIDLSEYIFYIDGYYNFSPSEYKVIEELIKKSKKVVMSIISEVDRYTNFKLEHLVKREVTKQKVYKFLNLDNIRDDKKYALDIYRKSHEMITYINSIIKKNSVKKFNIISFYSTKKNQNYKINLTVEGSKIEVDSITEYKENRFITDELYYLQKEFSKLSKSFRDSRKVNVTVYESPDLESEIKQLARNISKEIVENNYNLRDIAIMYREESYEKYCYILEEYGINLHIDKNIDVSSHRLIKLIKNIFDYKDNNFKQDILNILKNKAVNVKFEFSLSDIEMILESKLVNSIEDLEKEYFEHPMEYFTSEELKKVKISLLALAEMFNKIKKKKIISHYVKELLKILTSLGVEEKLVQQKIEKLSLKDLEEKNINQQIFEKIIKLIEDLKKQDGKKIDFESFKKIFFLLLDKITYRSIPRSEEFVIMSKMDLSKVENKKIVFIIGMNKDVLPKTINLEGIIDDESKYSLSKYGIELSPRSRSLMIDEDFVAYIALTRAREKIYLSYSKYNSKYQLQKPSIYVDTIYRILDDSNGSNIKKYIDDEIVFDISKIEKYDFLKKDSQFYSQVEVMYFYKKIKYAMELEGNTQENLSVLNEKYSKLLTTLGKKYDFDDVQDSVKVNEESIEKYSFSKLHRYEENPFIYFVENVLGVIFEKEFDFSPLLVGAYKHAILEDGAITSFINEKTEKFIDNDLLEISKYIESLENEISSILEKIVGETVHPDIKKLTLIAKSQRMNSYAIDGILKEMVKTISIEIYYQIISGYKVYKKEEKFILDCKPDSINLILGNKIKITKNLDAKYKIRNFKLSGIIDRIDRKNESFIVIDYKSSKTDFEIDKFYDGGISQLLIYMLATLLIEDTQLTNIKGIFYRELAKKNKENKEYRLRGLMNESLLKEMNMISELIFMRTKKDGSPFANDDYKVCTDVEFSRLLNKNIEHLYTMVKKIQNSEYRLESVNQENKYLFDYSLGERVVVEKEYEKILAKDFKKLIFKED